MNTMQCCCVEAWRSAIDGDEQAALPHADCLERHIVENHGLSTAEALALLRHSGTRRSEHGKKMDLRGLRRARKQCARIASALSSVPPPLGGFTRTATIQSAAAYAKDIQMIVQPAYRALWSIAYGDADAEEETQEVERIAKKIFDDVQRKSGVTP